MQTGFLVAARPVGKRPVEAGRRRLLTPLVQTAGEKPTLPPGDANDASGLEVRIRDHSFAHQF